MSLQDVVMVARGVEGLVDTIGRTMDYAEAKKAKDQFLKDSEEKAKEWQQWLAPKPAEAASGRSSPSPVVQGIRGVETPETEVQDVQFGTHADLAKQGLTRLPVSATQRLPGPSTAPGDGYDALQAKASSKYKVDPIKVFQYLRQKGLSETQAMGILPNIKGESWFNPNAKAPSGEYGLFQHLGDRQQALFKYSGTTSPSWKQQVDYALTEPEMRRYLSEDYQRPEDATVGFIKHFEKPKYPEKDAQRRLGYLPSLMQDVRLAGSATAPSGDPQTGMRDMAVSAAPAQSPEADYWASQYADMTLRAMKNPDMMEKYKPIIEFTKARGLAAYMQSYQGDPYTDVMGFAKHQAAGLAKFGETPSLRDIAAVSASRAEAAKDTREEQRKSDKARLEQLEYDRLVEKDAFDRQDKTTKDKRQSEIDAADIALKKAQYEKAQYEQIATKFQPIAQVLLTKGDEEVAQVLADQGYKLIKSQPSQYPSGDADGTMLPDKMLTVQTPDGQTMTTSVRQMAVGIGKKLIDANKVRYTLAEEVNPETGDKVKYGYDRSTNTMVPVKRATESPVSSGATTLSGTAKQPVTGKVEAASTPTPQKGPMKFTPGVGMTDANGVKVYEIGKPFRDKKSGKIYMVTEDGPIAQ